MNAYVAPSSLPPGLGQHGPRPTAATSPLRRHGGTLVILLVVALAHLGAWWAMNRPVAMPDFRGQVNGLAFAPYQRGQSAEGQNWPTAEQIEGDLRRVAPMTRHVGPTRPWRARAIPEIAWSTGLDLRITLGSWLDPAAGP
jgi:hypothetical protein